MIHSSEEANGKIMIKNFRSGYSGSFKGGKLTVVGRILQYFGFLSIFPLSREAALSYFAHNGGDGNASWPGQAMPAQTKLPSSAFTPAWDLDAPV
jgi:hypothetical protein